MITTAVSRAAGSEAVAQDDLQRLKEATGQIVGSVFYGTLLKSMRESELKGAYGHGGRGEEVFAAQLHGMWAERMGEASNGGLTDVLYRRLEHQQRLMSQGRERAAGEVRA
jgi:Rod binding domain-containing protein